ncbi:MAG: DUF2760 domain-containing protein [Planctomycetaceae bacterium]|nr:DUF2760 domain-containing protein [Planctomycetaceae bacterium]
MGRIKTAFRAFFRALGDAELARNLDSVLDGTVPTTAGAAKALSPPTAPVAAEPARKPKPARSEALTLLETLQREGRLIDFLKESLDGFSDAQIGAAARDVHRESAAVIERLFAVRPLSDQSEGATLEVAEGFDPLRYRLTGNVAGKPPFRGTLAHHGWQATKCELPAWTGGEAAARIVAPIELDVR